MTIISDVPVQLHKEFSTPATDSRLPLVQLANISSVSASDILKNAESHELTETSYRKTLEYRSWRSDVSTALLDYGGLDDEALAFWECSDHPLSWIPSDTKDLPKNAATVWTCSHNATHPAALFMPSCDLRICPDCAAKQTARLAARYIPKAIELSKVGGRYHLRHIVFTTPIELTSDTPDKIHKKIKELSKLPRQAMQIVSELGDSLGRDYKTLGAIQSAEFGTEGHKLHFHVIQYGSYLPQKELSDAWHEVTGGQANVVFIRAIDKSSEDATANDVIETLKYSVKFWKKNADTGEIEYLPPNVMPHLLLSLKGLRRIKSWGVFYKLPKVEKSFNCPQCDHEMQRIGCENWHYWIEHGATAEDIRALKQESFLQYKLANKSKFNKPDGNKPPPDYSSKDRQIFQKSLFTDDFSPSGSGHYSQEDNF